jgi:hypothetical protein
MKLHPVSQYISYAQPVHSLHKDAVLGKYFIHSKSLTFDYEINNIS